jgi:hypothetical protein
VYPRVGEETRQLYVSIGRKDATATGREFSGWPVFRFQMLCDWFLSTCNEINRSVSAEDMHTRLLIPVDIGYS